MARYTGPSCRQCRAEGAKLFLKGERCFTNKCPVAKKASPPGKDPRYRQRKISDYGLQLREKQKLKRMYGLLEKQFKLFFDEAERLPGKTGENLITRLERRLDNTVYRMHFASSRKQARQIVSHGHVFVNGKRVTIPSFILKEYSRSGVYPWLQIDPDTMKGTVKAYPRKADVNELAEINEQLIVELYSR